MHRVVGGRQTFSHACMNTKPQALSDYVRYFLASHSIDLGRSPSVFTAAKLMSTLIYRNKDNLMGTSLPSHPPTQHKTPRVMKHW